MWVHYHGAVTFMCSSISALLFYLISALSVSMFLLRWIIFSGFRFSVSFSSFSNSASKLHGQEACAGGEFTSYVCFGLHLVIFRAFIFCTGPVRDSLGGRLFPQKYCTKAH